MKAGDIKIAYYSLFGKDRSLIKLPERRFVKLDESDDADELDEQARAYFLLSLEPDSLVLRIGPYAKLEKPRGLTSLPNTFERAGDVILNVHENGFIPLRPYEHLVIGTNEYIEVSSKVGGSLSSNVRNTDIGISHISTIIDPSWAGILQVGLSNETGYTKTLKYHDPLCIVRFHEHSKTSEPEVIDRFRGRRPHFGIDWWLLEREQGRQFFPRRHEYAPSGEFERRLKREKRLAQVLSWLKFLGPAFVIGGVVSAAFYVAQLSSKIDNVIKNSSKIEESLRRIELGSQSFVLSPQNPTSQVKVRFERPVVADPFVTYEFLNASAAEIYVEITRDVVKRENTALYTGITFNVTLLAKERREFTIKWAIIHDTFLSPN